MNTMKRKLPEEFDRPISKRRRIHGEFSFQNRGIRAERRSEDAPALASPVPSSSAAAAALAAALAASDGIPEQNDLPVGQDGQPAAPGTIPVPPPPPPPGIVDLQNFRPERRHAYVYREVVSGTPSNPQAAAPGTTLNPQVVPRTPSNPQAATPGTTLNPQVVPRTPSNPQAAAPGTTLNPEAQGRTEQILIVRDDTEEEDSEGEDPDPPVSIFVLNPDTWWYRLWCYFIIILSVCSSFFTPLEFAFYTDFPDGSLSTIDLVVGLFFFLDLLMLFLTSYRDDQTELMVNRHRSIAVRCLKSYHTYFKILAACPWDYIYANIGMNNRFIRILKSFAFMLYYIHTGGCIFYYLATFVPEPLDMHTWIGSMAQGHFRQIAFGSRYVQSLYFAVVTVSTVGYGDAHAVTYIEMIFTTIYVLLSMGLVPYLTNFALQGM